MTRLRVMSNTGRPRRRGPFTFDVQPQVVDVDPDRVFPANAAEAKQFGVPWYKSWDDPRSFDPAFRAYASRPDYHASEHPSDPKVAPATDPNPPGKLIDLIMADTDLWEDGIQIRHGGLIVIDVAADFVEPTELKQANAQLAGENETLRARLRKYEPSGELTGAPERLGRKGAADRPRTTTTPDDFGAPRAPAPVAPTPPTNPTPAQITPTPEKPVK